MNNASIPGVIRPKVICLFRNANRILVIQAHDPATGACFYVPPGGGIEFGESSLVALHREMREELDLGIESPILLGVLENVFTYDGRPGHEIVFVYRANPSDQAISTKEFVTGGESDGTSFQLVWLDLDQLKPGNPPLYPEGLLALLHKDDTPPHESNSL